MNGFYAARASTSAGASLDGFLTAVHSVEWGWFLGPSDCGGGMATTGGVQDLMKQLQSVKIVSCAEAAWRFLGLSLAGWNAVASIALFGLALIGLVKLRRG